MKKSAVIIAASLAVSAALANAPVSAFSMQMSLDTRTQGAATLQTETQIDSRGMTFDISDEIDLNTMKRVPTLILVR